MEEAGVPRGEEPRRDEKRSPIAKIVIGILCLLIVVLTVYSGPAWLWEFHASR